MSEVVIVGGGLAGAGAATLLARAGRRVTLLEREVAPHDKICGEFLSIGARRRLTALGLDPATLTEARIGTLRLIVGAQVASAPLPFEALGVTRRRLDAALLDRAAAAGAAIARGVHVRAHEGETLRTSAGDLAAPTLLLATGKHDLRGLRRPAGQGDTRQVGFKMYWRPGAAARRLLAGHIDIALIDGGYAGLQLVEGGVANLCTTVRADRLRALGGWAGLRDRLLAIPHLARLLGDAEPLLDQPITISRVPYGYRHAPVRGERVWRLGDQAAVIPSFCGDGMAMALASAFRCADMLARGATAEDHHRALRPGFARQLAIAGAVHRIGLRPRFQPLLPPIVRAVPRLATWLAAATRVREDGVLRHDPG